MIEKIYSIIYGDEDSSPNSTHKPEQSNRQKSIVVYSSIILFITFFILILINILKKIESL